MFSCKQFFDTQSRGNDPVTSISVHGVTDHADLFESSLDLEKPRNPTCQLFENASRVANIDLHLSRACRCFHKVFAAATFWSMLLFPFCVCALILGLSSSATSGAYEKGCAMQLWIQ